MILLKLLKYLYLRGTFSCCEPIKLPYTQGSKSYPYFQVSWPLLGSFACEMVTIRKTSDWIKPSETMKPCHAIHIYHVFPIERFWARDSYQHAFEFSHIYSRYILEYFSKAISDSHLLTWVTITKPLKTRYMPPCDCLRICQLSSTDHNQVYTNNPNKLGNLILTTTSTYLNPTGKKTFKKHS